MLQAVVASELCEQADMGMGGQASLLPVMLCAQQSTTGMVCRQHNSSQRQSYLWRHMLSGLEQTGHSKQLGHKMGLRANSKLCLTIKGDPTIAVKLAWGGVALTSAVDRLSEAWNVTGDNVGLQVAPQ